jgi:hypothetical protein
VARTPKGEPFPEASVALLPDPPHRERTALYGTCMADASGVCTLHGIASGEYHVLAVSMDLPVGGEPRQLRSRELLAHYNLTTLVQAHQMKLVLPSDTSLREAVVSSTASGGRGGVPAGRRESSTRQGGIVSSDSPPGPCGVK